MMNVLTLCAAVLLLVGCKKPATCHGKVSDDDIASWRAKAQKGVPTCEELTKATVALVPEGVTVNGETIHTGFRAGEKKDAIPHLNEVLNADRETWARIHPGQQFKGIADFTIPDDRPAGHGVSVTWILVSEGYALATMHSGDVTLTADLWPGPQGKGASAVAHVERENGTELHLRFSGPGVPSGARRIVSPDLNDLQAQLAKDWNAPSGTPRALVVRTNVGTFHDLLTLARDVLALPAAAHVPVAFEVGRPLN